ncbi:MAG: recombination-associated protein RdgC [Legionellales bacterium RIFCSPHIGHO2_12_FULL_35_11]|nr:MAG: recombination-associated protein RdgC [Legionellales bacterium RIFCSPHIGHO2_12_FULL_35_11]
MWFNNALIYQYELDNSEELLNCLKDERLKPCPAHARFTFGWVPAVTDELVYEITGTSLICLGKEERILPKSVINRYLAEKIQTLEAERGFPVKRAEKGQLAEDIEFDLLPKAFCLQKRLPAIVDSISKRLIINSSSSTQASQLIALLRKSIPGIKLEPVNTESNLAVLFTSWIKNPASLPKNIDLAANCLLFSADNEKKQFNCKGYELPADEVDSLLSQGLVAAEVELVWNERIQFTLTQDLVFKRLKCLDYLVDEFHEANKLDIDNNSHHDAELTLLSGELRSLFDFLIPQITNKKTKQDNFEAITAI